ncbi:MAG: portal protein, partial [Pseudomonadales bacterium]
MAQLEDEEILAKIHHEVNAALGYEDEISEQRKEALLRYTSQPYGNEVEGRSQVVDTTVMDTIEWIKPSLMRVFTSGDEVVKFLPEGPEDVPAAQQATDYINWILTRKNNWSEIFLTWISDA